MEYGEIINTLSCKFPKEEMCNLCFKIRRATDLIALNISEGAIGQSKTEFKRQIGFSIRSLAEVVTCLYKAKTRGYISDEEFKSNYEFAYNLMNILVAYKGKMK